MKRSLFAGVLAAGILLAGLVLLPDMGFAGRGGGGHGGGHGGGGPQADAEVAATQADAEVAATHPLRGREGVLKGVLIALLTGAAVRGPARAFLLRAGQPSTIPSTGCPQKATKA